MTSTHVLTAERAPIYKQNTVHLLLPTAYTIINKVMPEKKTKFVYLLVKQN